MRNDIEHRLYRGRRELDDNGNMVASVVIDEPEGENMLDPRYDLRNHSPDGFEWGYEGSGPSQLALAILADATGDDEFAQENYQLFKRDVIAKLTKGEPFALTARFVQVWAQSVCHIPATPAPTPSNTIALSELRRRGGTPPADVDFIDITK